MGPFKNPSVGGSRYTLMYLDDYSEREREDYKERD
jgi:hypothetical protein